MTDQGKTPPLYTCPKCGARYAHDDAYRHAVKDCPKRAQPEPRIP